MPPAQASQQARALPSLRECKIRASLLLKALRSDDERRAIAAAERIRALPMFARLDAARIVAWRDDVRRKHALATIAVEHGFDSWNALRDACAPDSSGATMEWMFDAGAVFLNHWCSTYQEAAAIHAEAGGFLFSYGRQFVVCAAELLLSRGVDAYDPDWNLIGRDAARPTDPAAFDRLMRRWGRVPQN